MPIVLPLTALTGASSPTETVVLGGESWPGWPRWPVPPVRSWGTAPSWPTSVANFCAPASDGWPAALATGAGPFSGGAARWPPWPTWPTCSPESQARHMCRTRLRRPWRIVRTAREVVSPSRSPWPSPSGAPAWRPPCAGAWAGRSGTSAPPTPLTSPGEGPAGRRAAAWAPPSGRREPVVARPDRRAGAHRGAAGRPPRGTRRRRRSPRPAPRRSCAWWTAGAAGRGARGPARCRRRPPPRGRGRAGSSPSGGAGAAAAASVAQCSRPFGSRPAPIRRRPFEIAVHPSFVRFRT